jgi:hypothetical protein
VKQSDASDNGRMCLEINKGFYGLDNDGSNLSLMRSGELL